MEHNWKTIAMMPQLKYKGKLKKKKFVIKNMYLNR